MLFVACVTARYAARCSLPAACCPLSAVRVFRAAGCAGVYTAHAALELYAEAFDEAGALQVLCALCPCTLHLKLCSCTV